MLVTKILFVILQHDGRGFRFVPTPDTSSFIVTMKINLTSFLSAILAVSIILTSCSKHEIANPIDAVGAGADAVVVANPKEFYDVLLKLSDNNLSDDIQKVKGLCLDRMAAAYYKQFGKNAILFMAVEDRGELEKSLSSLGFKKQDADAYTIFLDEQRAIGFAVDEDYLRAVPASSFDEVAAMADSVIKLASVPLPQWKRDILENVKSLAAVSNIGDTDASLNVELSGSKAFIKLCNHDSKVGQAVNWLPAASYEHIGSWASGVNKNALFAFAVAKCDFSPIIMPIGRFFGHGLSRTEASMASAMLSGPLYGDISVDGDAITDFDKISANITLTSSSPVIASTMVKGIGRELKDNMIPCQVSGSSFSAEFDGAEFYGTAEGDKVAIHTRYQSKSSAVNPTELADCIAWISFDIPKKIIANLTAHDDFGLKGNVHVKDSVIEAEIEFTGTDDSFMSNISKILNR